MDGATVLQNVISIPSNSDVYRAYFQPKAFTVLSDAYAIQWKNSGGNIANAQYLFFVSCINKVTDLPIYSYKNKLGGWNVVQNKYIQVPVKDGKINFEFMSNLISAIYSPDMLVGRFHYRIDTLLPIDFTGKKGH